MFKTRHRASRAIALICLVTLLSTCCISSMAYALPVNTDYSSTYGSGNFGTWIVDANGMPAYRYDHSSQGAQQTFVNQNPFHQLGNNATISTTHDFGYTELFTTRTFTRFANRFDTERQSFSGGFGWVYDRTASQLWSTYYPDKPAEATYQLDWGMGYARKTTAYNGVSVDQYTFSPLGDDEVLMEKITITNTSGASKTLSYYDYWSYNTYVVRFPIPNIITGSYYESDWYETKYDSTRKSLKAISHRNPSDLTQSNSFIDPSSKTFFAALLGSDTVAGYETLNSRVFSSGMDHPWPDAMNTTDLTNSLTSIFGNTTDKLNFVIENRFTLAAGASKTMYVLYGMTRKGQENTLIDTYRSDYLNRFTDMVNYYKDNSVKFNPGTSDTWLTREMAWDSYYLQSGVMLEDWFGSQSHILNQSSTYMLDWGQNISQRDALQHIMPLIYCNPQLAKETIRFELQCMFTGSNAGKITYGTSGYGGESIGDLTFEPSDLQLWLIWAVCEYVNATRDYAFLNETTKYFHSTATDTTYNKLKAALNYTLDTVGKGSNGLVRIMNGDWNDGITSESPNPSATENYGESTLNTAIALIAYPMFKDLAQRQNDSATVTALNNEINSLRSAMQNQWRTNMFNRAYVRDESNQQLEVGANTLWLESNAFSLLVDNLLTPAQIDSLTARITNDVSDPCAAGANLLGILPDGDPYKDVRPQTDTSWYSICGALVRGLAKQAPNSTAAKALAWTEFKKNTLVTHAALYPNQYYGIVSGPDAVFTELNTPQIRVPGTNWQEASMDGEKAHPMLNMHSHSQALQSSLALCGVSSNNGGYVINPQMPVDFGFGWESSTFGIQYEQYAITGKIKALAADAVTMTVTLSNSLNGQGTLYVKQNGQNISFTRNGNVISFNLSLIAGTIVSWSITAN